MTSKTILSGFILSLLFCLEVNGQKVLQIEKYGSPKTKKIYIGEQITFRILDYDFWATVTIEEILLEADVLSFHNSFMPLNQIDAFRIDINWGRFVDKQMLWFGAGWSF